MDIIYRHSRRLRESLCKEEWETSGKEFMRNGRSAPFDETRLRDKMKTVEDTPESRVHFIYHGG